MPRGGTVRLDRGDTCKPSSPPDAAPGGRPPVRVSCRAGRSAPAPATARVPVPHGGTVRPGSTGQGLAARSPVATPTGLAALRTRTVASINMLWVLHRWQITTPTTTHGPKNFSDHTHAMRCRTACVSDRSEGPATTFLSKGPWLNPPTRRPVPPPAPPPLSCMPVGLAPPLQPKRSR